jgi:cell shape-determining protein MreC
MSTLGKIILALNVILAGAFVGWAGNSLGKTEELKQRMQAELDKVTADFKAKDAELTQKLAELSTEKQAKDTSQAERNQFENDAKRLTEELDAAKRQNDQLTGDIAKINSTMSGLNERLGQIEQTKDAAQAAVLKMQGERDEAVTKAEAAETARRTAEENRKNAELQIAALEKERKSTRTELEKAKAINAQYVAQFGVSVADQPDVTAQVIRVDTSLKPGLVALNVGSNHGIKRGHEFEVYSGTTYKGKVKVEQVHPDMCSALITVAGSGQISAGDSASTRL